MKMKTNKNDNLDNENISKFCYSKLWLDFNNVLIMHFECMDNFKRLLDIKNRVFLLKSANLSKNNDYIVLLADQILKLSNSQHVMSQSTMWLYKIKLIIDKIVNDKRNKNENSYKKISDLYYELKSELITNYKNYIVDIESEKAIIENRSQSHSDDMISDHDDNYQNKVNDNNVKKEEDIDNLTNRLNDLLNKSKNTLLLIKNKE